MKSTSTLVHKKCSALVHCTRDRASRQSGKTQDLNTTQSFLFLLPNSNFFFENSID